jgi:hypothetical protein
MGKEGKNSSAVTPTNSKERVDRTRGASGYWHRWLVCGVGRTTLTNGAPRTTSGARDGGSSGEVRGTQRPAILVAAEAGAGAAGRIREELKAGGNAHATCLQKRTAKRR